MGALLSAQELERAEAIRDLEARERWIAARGLLRKLLGGWMGVSPRSLEFELGRYGKPRLRLAGPTFNVSHSSRLALYAICADMEVGVDVELLDRGVKRRNDVAVARRLLGEDVARELSALTGQAQAAAFLKAWVAHEASVKCWGTGIGYAESERDAGQTRVQPWVSEIDVGEGAYAALAVEGGPVDVVAAEVLPA